MVELFGILFLTIVAPLWIIFHYASMWKRSKTITGEDEKMLSDLYRMAETLDQRLNNLERILEAEDKDWRRAGREQHQ